MWFWTRTVTVVTAREVIVRGVKTLDWSDPVRTPVEGCEFQPAQGGRDYELGTGWWHVFNVYLPAGMVVPHEARLELEGVDGQFTIMDGPHLHQGAAESYGLPDTTSHVKLTVGARNG